MAQNIAKVKIKNNEFTVKLSFLFNSYKHTCLKNSPHIDSSLIFMQLIQLILLQEKFLLALVFNVDYTIFLQIMVFKY